MTRRQLLELGFTSEAIRHRLDKGRLHPARTGVYAVGRPELSGHGRWMAAVLACGSGAALSHGSAAALWGIGNERDHEIELSVPAANRARPSGLRVHRRASLAGSDATTRHAIPLTSPVRTLLDLASYLSRAQLEAAVNAADKLDLIDPDSLRSALESRAGQPGVRALRDLLDRHTFVLTDSELERRFLPIARRAGLRSPITGRYLNGFKVDFFWPDLGLVVETDGLRYHRTPTQQARDRRRDHAHMAAGLTPIRFSHAQVRYEPDYVRRTLMRVAGRITSRS